MKNKIPDIIIERAVELWRRAIIGGDWDNGDAMSNAVALMTRPESASEELVREWADKLIIRLKFIRDNDGKPRPESEGPFNEYDKDYHFISSKRLFIDYNVVGEMLKVAQDVGINVRLFPCKSSVHIRETHVESSFGYAADHFNHYPLSSGKWLVTTLSEHNGEDMRKIIDAVEQGVLTNMVVED